MRFPWQKTAPGRELTFAEKAALSSAKTRANVRRVLYEPNGRARGVMRKYRPQLVEAEAALATAQERGRQATDEAAELDRQARRRAADVATGETTAATAEAAMVAARRAALALPGFEAAVEQARARVEREERAALDVIAEQARRARQQIEARVAKVIPVLTAALEAEDAVVRDLKVLESTEQRRLLGERDCGRTAEWPACALDHWRVWSGVRSTPPRPPSGGAAA